VRTSPWSETASHDRQACLLLLPCLELVLVLVLLSPLPRRRCCCKPQRGRRISGIPGYAMGGKCLSRKSWPVDEESNGVSVIKTNPKPNPNNLERGVPCGDPVHLRCAEDGRRLRNGLLVSAWYEFYRKISWESLRMQVVIVRQKAARSLTVYIHKV
jgi:hypothetical protein